MIRVIAHVVVVLTLPSTGAGTVTVPVAANARSLANDDITFWKDIRPIFQKNCTICHSPKNIAKKEIGGGLALTSYQSVVADPKDSLVRPGNSRESALFQILVTKDEEKRMPKDGDPLSDRDVELIRKWIDGGAKEGERPETLPAETEAPTPRKNKTALEPVDVMIPTGLTLTAETLNTLELNTVQPGKLELALKVGPLPPITALAFGSDGKWLAVGNYGSISVWNLEQAALVKSIEAPGAVHSIAISPGPAAAEVIAAAGGLPARSGAVLILETKTWQTVKTLGEHTDVVYEVAFSPDGQKLASASLDKTIRVWTTSDWNPIQTLKGHSDFVFSVSFTPDGKRLISSSKDRSIKVHNAETWETERTLTGHNEEVLTTAVSGDSYNVVSAGKEPQLRWWIIENGQNNRTIPGHNGSVNQIVFSRDGKRIASVGQDRQVRTWDGSDGKLLRTIAGPTEWLYAVAFSPDAKFVAAGSWNGLVYVWETKSGRLLATLINPPSPDFDKPQWFIATPEGFFQASPDIVSLGQWRTNGQGIPGDRINAALRQAEPVRRAVRGEAIESPKLDAIK